MEFYNLVFMEYDLRPGPELVPLPNQNVDTGLGVERGDRACSRASSSVFDTDGFRLIMDWVERESGVAYGDNPVATKAHRVLADHGRAMSFLIADGVTPSNEGRGYICRRIIRRAVQHGQRIGLEDVYRLGGVVVEQMGDAYPELRSTPPRSSASSGSRRSASARRSRAARRSSTSSPAATRSPARRRSSSRRPTASRSS